MESLKTIWLQRFFYRISLSISPLKIHWLVGWLNGWMDEWMIHITIPLHHTTQINVFGREKNSRIIYSENEESRAKKKPKIKIHRCAGLKECVIIKRVGRINTSKVQWWLMIPKKDTKRIISDYYEWWKIILMIF